MKFRASLKSDRPKRTIFETTHGRNENACNALTDLRKMRELKAFLHVKNRLVEEKDDFFASKCKNKDDMSNNKKAKEAAESAMYRVPDLSGPDAAETGLSLQNSGFAIEAKEAILELQNDEMNSQIRAVGAKRQRMMWDRKRKRFVGQKTDGNAKKIRTESGAVISASYKTDAYDKWLKTSNTGMIAAKTVSFEDDDNNNGDKGDNEDNAGGSRKRYGKGDKKTFTKKPAGKPSFKLLNSGRSGRFNKNNQGQGPQRGGNGKGEAAGQKGRMLRPEQAMKKMKEKNKVKDFQQTRRNMNKKKRN